MCFARKRRPPLPVLNSVALGLALMAMAPVIQAAEPVATASDLPSAPPVPPEAAVKTIHVKPGFHVELVAAESNVSSPVAMAFDERGRLFVVEMIDYSERRDVAPHLGRIRLLEDTNGDGIFDKSTVYADNLPWPTAVFCYGGGVFVGSTPDILFLKDTDGDGKADVREKVFTGFAAGVARLNVQELLNSFIWGLDNRIHGATSGEGGRIKSLRHPEAPVLDLHGRDFAIDPRTMTMTAEAGGGQHGLSFDDYGRRFTCNNSDHVRCFMYDERYAARNPAYPMPPPLVSIAADGPAAEVYRLSPEEPWRVIRTRWRVAGLVSGPIEGGGRSSGYFTGATGITIYRGSAFPPEYLDNVFVGECSGNLVHRKVLHLNGVELTAQRPADEEHVEFLASTDNWFRPVQFANAPDGTLYVIDMHREIVEHPWSLPDGIKRFLDLNRGAECGRIFRIVPDGFKQPPPPRLDLARTAELVATLENPNGWHRDTASRLVYERQDPKAVPPLRRLLANSKSALGRLHALHALAGLGALQEAQLQWAFKDADLWVRVHAIQLSEQFAANPSAELLGQLRTLAADPSELVRYQLAFTLGEFTQTDQTPALAQIVRRDAASRWVQAAVLSSLATGAGELFDGLSAEPSFTASPGGQEFLRQVALLVGVKNKSAEVGRVLNFAVTAPKPEVAFALVRALGDGLKRAGNSLSRADGRHALPRLFAQANKLAADGAVSETARLASVQFLGLADFEDAGPTLVSLLKPGVAPSLQLAALGALARFSEPQIASSLVEFWGGFSARVRSQALAVLLSRAERAKVLLQAIAKGVVPPDELTTAQQKFLRNHNDPSVRQAALQVLGAATSSQLQEIIEHYRPALDLKGDAAKGREIYLRGCVSCHRLGGAGFALGPDLETVKNSGKEKLLVNILDPNREVAPQYLAYQVDTKDGESLVGLIVHESASSLTVRQAYGKEDLIPRANLQGQHSLGQSLMPEGLEQGLSLQDFANLLELLSTAAPNR